MPCTKYLCPECGKEFVNKSETGLAPRFGANRVADWR